MASMVSEKKSVINLIENPMYIMNHFFLLLSKFQNSEFQQFDFNVFGVNIFELMLLKICELLEYVCFVPSSDL